jgi:hypothetical protein
VKASQYAKAITAVVGQALTFASLYYGGNKYVAAAVAAAAALGVYAVPNADAPKPPPPPSGT